MTSVSTSIEHPEWVKKNLVKSEKYTIHPSDNIRTTMLCAKPQAVAKLLRGEAVVDTPAGSIADKGTALHLWWFREAPNPELFIRIAVPGTGKYITGHIDSYCPERCEIRDLKTSDSKDGLEGIGDSTKLYWMNQQMLYTQALHEGEVWAMRDIHASTPEPSYKPAPDGYESGEWVPAKTLFPQGVKRVVIDYWDGTDTYPDAAVWEGSMLSALTQGVWSWAQSTVIEMMAGTWRAPSTPVKAEVDERAGLDISDDVLWERYIDLKAKAEEFEKVKAEVKDRLAEGQRLSAAGHVFQKTKPSMKRVLADDWAKRIPKPLESYQVRREYTALDMDAVQADLFGDSNAWMHVPASSPSLRVTKAKGG